MTEAEQRLASLTKILQLVLDDPRNQICSAYRITLMSEIAKAEAAAAMKKAQTIE